MKMPCVKPIDRDAILSAAKDCKVFITAEDNNILGGLGSAVAEVLSESGGASLKRLGLNDTFAQSGDLEQLLDYYGFNVRDLVNTITEEIKNAKR